MIKHFEDLWLKCENFHKENVENDTSIIIDEVMMKLNLYKILHEKEIPNEEKQKMKYLAFGEILLSLTNLSLKDDINVFSALLNTLNLKQKD